MRHPKANLSKSERGVIIALHEAGHSTLQIAQSVQCERHTVYRWIRKYQLGGLEALKDHRKGNSGARKTRVEEDELLVSTVDERPFSAAGLALHILDFNISESTARRRLREAKVRSQRAASKIALTEEHRRRRLDFARRNLNIPQQEWNAIIWMDEKVFSSAEEGRFRVWRPDGERLNPKYVLPSTHSGRIIIGFWGSMTSSGLMDLVEISPRMNAEEYIEILEETLKPSARRIYPEDQYPVIKIVHDNSSVHRSGLVQAWFEANPRFQQIEWPAKSPDLNPIENVWGKMKFTARAGANRTREHFRNYVHQTWNNLTMEEGYTQSLVNSMTRRLELIIGNNGYWIPY